LTHFYVSVFGKKYRICKPFFKYLETLKCVTSFNNKHSPVKPLLKWSGGKRGEIKTLINILPVFETYIEPFVGGGALFFHLNHHNNVINDTHFDLICFYNTIKEGNAQAIYDFMLKHPNNEECYY